MLLRKALLFTGLALTSVLIVVAQSPACPSRTAESLRALTLNTNNRELLESFHRISIGAQRFGLEFLGQISDYFQNAKIKQDFMVSPFSVWAVLLLLVEAAEKNTLSELRTALHIQDSKETLRAAFNEVQQYLRVKTENVDVESLQAMFVDSLEFVDSGYENILRDCYGSVVHRLQFNETVRSTQYINNIVREATHNLIPVSFYPEDLNAANLILISSLYFRGHWKLPFNRSLTTVEPFYDDEGNKIANVEMMMQVAHFNYSGIAELEGHVLELPYGNEDRLCMLIILPRKGVTVNKVIHNLQNIGVSQIFEQLAKSNLGYEDDEVEVYLPKFNTETQFDLNAVLEKMGIRDLFDSSRADFSKMSKRLFVSYIQHNTKIIVDEVGTKAAAATTAVLANKATPPKFYLNRPFVYLIAEKRSNLLLFAGQIVHPPDVSH